MPKIISKNSKQPATPKRPPRPLLELTLPVRNEIAKAIREGLPLQTAARAANASIGRLNKWLAHGKALSDRWDEELTMPPGMEQHDWDCLALWDAVDAATHDLLARLGKSIMRKAKKNPGIAMWLLERRDPETYSLRHLLASHNAKLVKEAPVPEKTKETNSQPKVTIYVPDNGRLLKNV